MLISHLFIYEVNHSLEVAIVVDNDDSSKKIHQVLYPPIFIVLCLVFVFFSTVLGLSAKVAYLNKINNNDNNINMYHYIEVLKIKLNYFIIIIMYLNTELVYFIGYYWKITI